MEKLKQNNLSEGTDALGFCRVLNANAEEAGLEAKVALVREVELEDGTIVKAEGMTPNAIKSALNEQVAGGITFETPGEPVQVYVDNTVIAPEETEVKDGLVQIYNGIEELANHVEPMMIDEEDSEIPAANEGEDLENPEGEE